ncbi:Abortive infection protein-like, C-terminal domain containing protein [Alkalidesulfovibrio alkalitolerans DSM 16529]|uniref:Abortive infection protein-like, C-terminal domain containing protein n=1 Tax=Alkalidesulfovibrio alkalitolerans DSM 16529 TaxID=1121439 RepID=S7TCS8_9BACT|nr:abortive infection family protein [Alkalidesulfovibrio alkalitolerans]EPR35022.1 Abortive infection protein-like, C-terminal domain containing protein [Alkalidesulfovibrio alkalitolerans DSM 16529]
MTKINPNVIRLLAKTITGDNQKAPYLKGPDLVDFFNQFGFDDQYSWNGGFPTRWVYAEEKIKSLIEIGKFRDFLIELVNPARFIESEIDFTSTIEYINHLLSHNDIKLSYTGRKVIIDGLKSHSIDFKKKMNASDKDFDSFIDDQIVKCDRKIENGDYDGAITNARTLLESVLHELESNLSAGNNKKDGDLIKMFKRVKTLMNMNEKEYPGNNAVLQLISGITSIVNGIATLSNEMGDRHARGKKPLKHHAMLCVNSSKTICEFMTSSFMHQAKNGNIICHTKQGGSERE